MNFYEELGVTPEASMEEIRHSYKLLARVLHPDQFPDEATKRLAGLQMRRLNLLLGTLSDAEQRRRYNARLGHVAVAGRRLAESQRMQPPPRVAIRPRITATWAWLTPVAALITFLGVVMYYYDGARVAAPVRAAEPQVAEHTAPPTVVSPPVPQEEKPAAPGPDRERPLAKLRSDRHALDTLRAEHQMALEQLALNSGTPAPVVFEPAPVLPRSTPAEVPAKGGAPAPWRFAGNWYYVPAPPESPAKGVYLPEYIELRLTENGATMRGRYRGRYRVTDQAISPEVAFEFEGTGSQPSAQLPWVGPGEAKGRVTLRLVSSDRMEVSWVASQLSAELNLASGTAELVRQRERE